MVSLRAMVAPGAGKIEKVVLKKQFMGAEIKFEKRSPDIADIEKLKERNKKK